MVLFLHNRYRTTGGEERAVADLVWLVREQLGERAELLTRSSASLGRRRATVGLLRGGLNPSYVARAVGVGGARVVHAHNLQPALGWRALAAARDAGARVVLHLHQYRLVCAIGVCFVDGHDCTRCHGRNTLPGVRHNCRGSLPEAAAYATSLALWQRRLVAQADALIVPSQFALERLRALGAPLPWERVQVLAPPVRALGAGDALGGQVGGERAHKRQTGGEHAPGGPGAGGYALVVSRLAAEKGIDVAIDACQLAGIPLVVAGDGPQAAALRAHAGDRDVRFAGHVNEAQLAELRAGAAVALVPSRSPETFGLAAAEAMAAGLPVVASDVGALPELVDRRALVPAGDADALAQAIARIAGDCEIAELGLRRVRELCSPEVVAAGLVQAYGGVERAPVGDLRSGI